MTDTNTAPKPRREWRVTKADLTGRIAELEARCERLAENARASGVEVVVERALAMRQRNLTALWRRLALAACGAFVVLGAWGWPW